MLNGDCLVFSREQIRKRMQRGKHTLLVVSFLPFTLTFSSLKHSSPVWASVGHSGVY